MITSESEPSLEPSAPITAGDPADVALGHTPTRHEHQVSLSSARTRVHLPHSEADPSRAEGGAVAQEDSTMKFSDELRRAIENAGMSRYRLAKNTGCSQQLLSAFVNGKSGISLATIDIIAGELGLHLVTAGRANRNRKPSGGGR